MFPQLKHFHTLLLAAILPLSAALPLAAQTPLAPQVSASSLNTLSFSWSDLGSPYFVAISTDDLFLVQAATGTLTGTTTTYINLGQNTTYYFRVKRASETDSAYLINGQSTSTWAAAASAPYFLSSFFTADSAAGAGASLGWSVNGNPEWTEYDLEYSKSQSFSPSSVARKNYPPVILGGLEANTTYYLRLRTRSLTGMLSAYTPPAGISTATLALLVSNVSETVYETSTTVRWDPVTNATIQALDSEGYRLILSTSELLNPLTVNWTTDKSTATSTMLTGLDRNTTYYYKTGSLNWFGVANSGDIRYFTSLAAKPQNLARLAVLEGAATLGWTALPASPQIASALGYRLDASTSASFSGGAVVHSSASYNVALSTLTINTLDANTTYYFRTSSLNLAYAPNQTSAVSSVTLALPLSPHTSLTTVYPAAQSMIIDFTPQAISPLETPPQAFSREGYRVEATTGAFGGTAPVFSSTTYDNQAGVLVISGLAPNNVYQLRIATLNWERTPNYTTLASTRTGIPGYLTNVTLDHVWSSSAVVSFDSGIAAEGHVAQASVDPYFEGPAITSATPNTAATTLSITGLDPNTTYYYRAGALYNGATIYTNTAPSMRQTLPLAVNGMNISAVFYSSVTASWQPRPESPQNVSANSYLLEVATSAAFAPVFASSVSFVVNIGSLTIGGLSPNTTYYFRNGTVNEQGYANYAPAASTATLANPPTSYAFVLTPDSINLIWPPNSNPADTRYLVEMNDGLSFYASSITVLSSATFSSLAPNTIYYSSVTAINRFDRRTPKVNFPSMATGAYHPVPAAVSGITVTGLTANWTEGGNTPLITNYSVHASSNSDFSGTVLSSVTKNLYASFDGLVSDASYYLRVSALNLSDVPTTPAVSLGTALTLPATAYILPLADTFSGLMTDGFTVNWASNGNSSYTVYQVQASTDPLFSVINASVSARALSCAFADLQVYTTYYLRLRALGQSGSLSDFREAGGIRTLLSSQLNAGAQVNNLITLETSYGTISVLVPSGALGGGTRLTIMPSTFTLPGPLSAVSQLTPTGIGLVITYFPQPLILNVITITLPYRITDLPAAMQADRSKLILALYDEVHGIWVPLPSVSDTVNNKVIAQTWHLSTFQIMQAQPEAGLANVKIYPNPYRPNSVSDVMHFTNMAPLAKVKIYTFLGELVRELKADVNGMAHWDGLNDAGRKVASGVYIAFIQTRDKKNQKSFKIAIER